MCKLLFQNTIIVIAKRCTNCNIGNMQAICTSVSQLPDIQFLYIPRNTGTAKSKKAVLIQQYSIKYMIYEFYIMIGL